MRNYNTTWPLIICCFLLIVQIEAQSSTGDLIYGRATFDRTGESVALSGDGTRLAIGSPNADDEKTGEDVGEVNVYEWQDGSWQQIGITLVGKSEGDLFGKRISLSKDGNYLAVAAPWDEHNGEHAGSVQIFTWDGQTWESERAPLYGLLGGDFLGTSLDMSDNGDYLIVGAVGADPNGPASGQAMVYHWNGRAYEQIGATIDGTTASNQLGTAVAISANGGRIVVAARYAQAEGAGKGQVKIYDWEDSAWVQQGVTLEASLGVADFGDALALSANGQRLAIGAPGENGAANPNGIVQVYDWKENGWELAGQVLQGDALGDAFGDGLAFSESGDFLLVGASKNDTNGRNAGQLKTYVWTDNTWVLYAEDVYGQKGGGGAIGGDRLGLSVAISADGKTIIGGAPGRPEAHVMVVAKLKLAIPQR